MNDREHATYTVRIHPDQDGLWAEVAELPGCFASGINLDELWESLQEALSLYLSDDEKNITARLVDHEDDVIEEPREFELCSA
ncbi:MAG: type II toxin-antitoxin system HicB family antitoxin [Mycobacterium sp.]|uniref:type II toxin-antitoxin system HicB family antitoxin n=1 Tax=Mycobacterium sp. TaxID=1785 RepID=UPI002621797E|nr:type II toxin-antitoxin system HicB family antitoxin [Mycobacterium sp.]MDI3315897.1 type II toxin-antitoxin system HicB family antitoxin [Mycobacterium sp.]